MLDELLTVTRLSVNAMVSPVLVAVAVTPTNTPSA